MFERIGPAPEDGLIALIGKFREDPRRNKIDGSVGVYRDQTGNTPIFAAVKEAERKLLERQTSKTYLGLLGDTAFNDAMAAQVLGPVLDKSRTRAMQAPGGCGALRNLMDLLTHTNPDTVLWVSKPTWVNHLPMAKAARLTVREYPYFDLASQTILFDQMMQGLKQAKAGDVVLLHGCCHNPTGADLSPAQWDELASFMAASGLIAFVDFAYQGFGEGLETDAYGVRKIASTLDETLIANSCSKNFGLYRDRVGTSIVIGKTSDSADRALGSLKTIARASYSMPPDHGAAVVSTILGDMKLTQSWKDELAAQCGRINNLRKLLADALRQRSNSSDFDFLTGQRGMFSVLPLTPQQVAELLQEHAVYMPSNGRINIAGIHEDKVDALAQAIVAVGAVAS